MSDIFDEINYKNPEENELIKLGVRRDEELNFLITVENKTFEREINTDQNFNIKNVHFKNVNFVNIDYFYNSFIKCIFENCKFTNLITDGFYNCKFVNCTFDGLNTNHNSEVSLCEFHNLNITENQENAKIFWLEESTFYDTDFSGQNTKILTGSSRYGENKSAITIEHYKFINSKIDLATIRKIAEERSGIHCREKYINHTKALHKPERKFMEPLINVYTENVDKEVFMNYIMALLTHDVVFEVDDDEEFFNKFYYFPVKIISKLSKSHIKIFDDNGKEIDYSKIVPFDFQLKNIRSTAKGFLRTFDMASQNGKIDPSLFWNPAKGQMGD